MPLTLIKDGLIVTPFGSMKENLWIEDSKIKKIGGTISNRSFEIYDAENYYVTPGLIDIHIHGGVGCDFLESSFDEMQTLNKDLIKHGITSIFPTLMSAPVEKMIERIKFLNEYIENQEYFMPNYLGINLEGPFISEKYKGIHPLDCINELNSFVLEKMLFKAIKIITLAPELDPEGVNIAYLKSRGIIVSMGHTDANYEQTDLAVSKGANLVTHLYNAMKRFHHRNPGILTRALYDDSLFVEIICDGVHVHPDVLKFTFKIKPKEKMILVSDSIAIREANGKEFYVGEEKIYVEDNKAVSSNGTLSGSITTVDQCVRNLVNWNIFDFPTAINFATYNPSKLLQIEKQKGALFDNCHADIVLWDKETLDIKATIIGGKIYEVNH